MWPLQKWKMHVTIANKKNAPKMCAVLRSLNRNVLLNTKRHLGGGYGDTIDIAAVRSCWVIMNKCIFIIGWLRLSLAWSSWKSFVASFLGMEKEVEASLYRVTDWLSVIFLCMWQCVVKWHGERATNSKIMRVSSKAEAQVDQWLWSISPQ